MRLLEWAYSVRLRLRSIFGRNRMERDLDAELRLHLEFEIEDGIERGLTPDAARLAARRRLGAIEQRKDECRDWWRVGFIDGVRHDIRFALRTLRKSPSFALVAIFSLSLGIGANTAIFSLMNALLIRPLPVARPESLALVKTFISRRPVGAFSGTLPSYSFSYPLFRQVEERNTAFSTTCAWWNQRVQLRDGGEMVLVPSVYASGEYFHTLGVSPVLGRTFRRDDDDPSGGSQGPVAVISDSFWERRYQRRSLAIGQSLTLNGVAVTIIGVMPPGFFGAEVGTRPDLWLPLNLARQMGDNTTCFNTPSCTFLRVMARITPGISLEQAETRLLVISRPSMEATLLPGMRADRKSDYLARTLHAEPGRSGYTSLRTKVRNPLQILMGLVGLVLLIACVNIANLLSARASARAREFGVRLALGASRARVVRQFLTESLVLAAGGAAGGFLFSLWATRLLVSILSSVQSPVRLNIDPDWRVLLFSTGIAVAAAFVFGIGPAVGLSRHGLSATLKERASQLRGAPAIFGAGKALMALQVALSVMLLSAAGLFAGTLFRLLTLNPGFDPRELTVVSLVNSRPPLDGPSMIRLLGRLQLGARTIPGVQSATVVSTTPLTNGGWSNSFTIPGRRDLTEDQRLADVNVVGTQFTATMRVRLLAGRDFNDSDTAQSDKVILISENAAQRWFPAGNALGRRITLDGAKSPVDWRIVGIVANSKYLSLREEFPLTVFLPCAQSNTASYIVLRTGLPVAATYSAFRSVLRQEASTTPIAAVWTMQQQMDESLSTERLTAYISVFIGGLALLLTSVGLYGMLAYFVTRRTGEIGIRMALGAQRTSVIWLVVRQAMGHTILGLTLGLMGVLAASRLVGALLYDVRPNDPGTIASAVGLLLIVCAIAASLPAGRASRLDPVQSLREE